MPSRLALSYRGRSLALQEFSGAPQGAGWGLGVAASPAVRVCSRGCGVLYGKKRKRCKKQKMKVPLQRGPAAACRFLRARQTANVKDHMSHCCAGSGLPRSPASARR